MAYEPWSSGPRLGPETFKFLNLCFQAHACDPRQHWWHLYPWPRLCGEPTWSSGAEHDNRSGDHALEDSSPRGGQGAEG